MSKTKTIQAPKATKSKKAPPATKGKPAPQPEAQAPTVGECPRGGDHEWTQENDERFCAKCKEPALAKANAAKPAKAKGKTKAAPKPKAKKVSALDAAAQVLASAKEPMSCQDLVEAMATQGLWSSPGGKTPHATLYSAIIREIGVKGNEARFVKADRGRFAAK